MATKLLLLSVTTILLWSCGVDGACVDDESAEFDSECITNFRFADDRMFPDDVGILHDSYGFVSLLGDTNPRYRSRDVDGITGTSDHGMFVERGGVCNSDLRACSTNLMVADQNRQNNWAFTSFIQFPSVSGVDGVSEVLLNVSYRFSECSGNPTCSNDFVTVYKQDADSALTEPLQTDPNRYQLLRGTEENSRLQQVGTLTKSVQWSIPRTQLPLNGFYLGFRDQGTCGQVGRILVYYRRNPAYTGTLLTCPSVPLPIATPTTTTQGTCCCGTNANNSSPLTVTCTSGSSCVEPASDVCGCAPGYTYNMPATTCEPCPAGMFQPDISTTSSCEACPANSESLLPATGVCRCTGATIRNPARPRDPCAEPPSSPLLTIEPTVDGTFVTVCWGAALDSGGLNDLHYNVYVRQTDATVYTKANSAPIVGTDGICHEVSGLNPSSSYAVVVTSANGATGDPETLDQQLSTVQGRFVAYFVDTGEAGLRRSEALALTFFLTLILVAVITAVIVFVIMWFVCVKKNTTVATSPNTNNGTRFSDVHVSSNEAYDTADEVKSRPTPPSRPYRPPNPPARPNV